MRVLVLIGIVAVGVGLASPGARADCGKATGKPLYRQEHRPLVEPAEGETTPVQHQTFAIYASGRWTWVGAGEAGSGEAMGRGGCISAFGMAEIRRAVARARFRRSTVPVATCDALPIARVTYAAPRRGLHITVETPCGDPVEVDTRRLVACAQAVMQHRPPAGGELRMLCRRGS